SPPRSPRLRRFTTPAEPAPGRLADSCQRGFRFALSCREANVGETCPREPSMSDVFVARQPIFNRDLEVVGYELLFRSREAQAIPSPEGATASVVLNAFTEIGLERIV